MTPWPTQIGYLPAVVVVGCVALALALVASRLRIGAQVARAAAGGAVVAIVAVDLFPDALADAGEEGIARWLVVLLMCVTFGLVRALRASHHHRDLDATPALMSVHGLVEGVVAGAGTGVNLVVGLPALVGMAIHKSVEGVDLALYLRGTEISPGGVLSLPDKGKRRIGWLTLNAAAPLAGIAASRSLALPRMPMAVTLSLLCGLLLHVSYQTCRGSLEAAAARTRRLAFSGGLVVTLLLAQLAGSLSS